MRGRSGAAARQHAELLDRQPHHASHGHRATAVREAPQRLVRRRDRHLHRQQPPHRRRVKLLRRRRAVRRGAAARRAVG